MKKFELTSEFMTNIFGVKLFRIRALIKYGAKFCYNIKARNLQCYRCQPKKREEMQNETD